MSETFGGLVALLVYIVIIFGVRIYIDHRMSKKLNESFERAKKEEKL